MIVEVCERFGGPSRRIQASQVLVRADDGTPLAVVSQYGPNGTYLVSCAGEDPTQNEDFRQALRTLGLDHAVFVRSLEDPPVPAGARLWTPSA